MFGEHVFDSLELAALADNLSVMAKTTRILYDLFPTKAKAGYLAKRLNYSPNCNATVRKMQKTHKGIGNQPLRYGVYVNKACAVL